MLEKSNFFIRNKRKIIIIGIIVILLVSLFFVSKFFFAKSRKKVFAMNIENNVATVERGNIISSITGSGTISPSLSKDITSEVSAEVTKVYVKPGDKVSKGDMLFELDSNTLTEQIKSKNNNVTSLSKNVNSIKEDIENLNVYATQSGYVSNLNLAIGDSVNKNSVICGIIDASNYIVTAEFRYNSNAEIKVGDKVTMLIAESFKYIEGTVTKATDMKKSSSLGGQTQSVEIEIINPGYTLEDIVVSDITVYTESGTNLLAISTSVIETNAPVNLKSKSSGTIKELYISEGSYVSEGSLIMVLENKDLSDNLSNARQSLNEAYNDLNDSKADYSLYKIVAPFDGTITSVNVVEGEKVRNDSQLARIINNIDIEFNIDVDELEISKLKVGQEAKVTIDAIESTVMAPVEGTVSYISIEGTTMSNVTSYPVTISLKGNDDIRMGMNCSTEVIISNVENVLILPVEAIDTKRDKYYVNMEDGSRREIEVGTYNEDYIEVVSGLEEGEKVLLPKTVIATNESKSTDAQSMSGFGGMGLMGGNMPFEGRSFDGGASRPNMNMGGFQR